MEFYRMAGDVDYMLRVVIPDMPSYDVFYKKLIHAVPLERHLAFRDGEDQVHHGSAGAAGSGGLSGKRLHLQAERLGELQHGAIAHNA
ncbi:hypothetical protein BJS_06925 [Bradyrhizobium japonicum SEMIA 5079]|nr:hypothetical protein BJS_06925 [Bradyrhizobium japonicum SEMIA 5079]